MEEAEVKNLIAECLTEYGRQEFLTLKEKEKLGKELFYAIRKLDILQEILEDTEITEIMINTGSYFYREERKAVCTGKLFFFSGKTGRYHSADCVQV